MAEHIANKFFSVSWRGKAGHCVSPIWNFSSPYFQSGLLMKPCFIFSFKARAIDPDNGYIPIIHSLNSMIEEGVLERSFVYVIACTCNHSERRDRFIMTRRQSILSPWLYWSPPLPTGISSRFSVVSSWMPPVDVALEYDPPRCQPALCRSLNHS